MLLKVEWPSIDIYFYTTPPEIMETGDHKKSNPELDAPRWHD